MGIFLAPSRTDAEPLNMDHIETRAFQEGNLKGIRDYCETDVLNTWLVYLRFQLMRGELDPTGYEQELTLLQDYLKAEGHPHFLGFLEAWQG